VNALYGNTSATRAHCDVTLLDYAEITERRSRLADGRVNMNRINQGTILRFSESAVSGSFTMSGPTALALLDELTSTAAIASAGLVGSPAPTGDGAFSLLAFTRRCIAWRKMRVVDEGKGHRHEGRRLCRSGHRSLGIFTCGSSRFGKATNWRGWRRQESEGQLQRKRGAIERIADEPRSSPRDARCDAASSTSCTTAAPTSCTSSFPCGRASSRSSFAQVGLLRTGISGALALFQVPAGFLPSAGAIRRLGCRDVRHGGRLLCLGTAGGFGAPSPFWCSAGLGFR